MYIKRNINPINSVVVSLFELLLENEKIATPIVFEHVSQWMEKSSTAFRTSVPVVMQTASMY